MDILLFINKLGFLIKSNVYARLIWLIILKFPESNALAKCKKISAQVSLCQVNHHTIWKAHVGYFLIFFLKNQI